MRFIHLHDTNEVTLLVNVDNIVRITRRPGTLSTYVGYVDGNHDFVEESPQQIYVMMRSAEELPPGGA